MFDFYRFFFSWGVQCYHCALHGCCRVLDPKYTPTLRTPSGIVKLTHVRRSPDMKVRGRPLISPLGSHYRACDLPPDLESFHHFLAVLAGRKEVASGTEVRRDGAIG